MITHFFFEEHTQYGWGDEVDRTNKKSTENRKKDGMKNEVLLLFYSLRFTI